ncbi:E3 ubiquitin-protein ligase listerin [Trichinella spiralis]|uniref:E3 ubiquitin-protein ligase listerin n=1 Tax=Trichinella spiralis TaxID=6334 RepID=A0A0V1B081_TRISP|nr:E3 ubiquitin-protein ligase listerin [Trichinella spiralis]
MVVRGGTSLLMSVNGDAKVGVHIPIDDYKFYFDYWRSRIIMVRRRYQRAQPSNSRRAAELVAESGGLRTFSVFAQNTASDSNVTAVTMMSLPIPFKDVFKKIFKKEVDTKYKDPISGIRKLSHEVCTAFLMKVLPCQRKPVDDALIYLLLGVFDPKKEVAVTAKDGINFFNSVTNTEFNSLFTENWCRTCCRMLINDEGTIPALSELDSRLDVTLSICLESLSWALGRSLITEGSPQFGVVQSLGKCITFWDLPLLCDEKLDLVNSWYRTVQSLVPVFIHSSQSLILKRLYTSIQKSMTSIQLCTFRYMFGVISELNKLVEDVWVHVDCGRFISCLATAISDSLDSDSLCDGAKLFAPFFAILPPASDDVKIQRIGLVVTNLACCKDFVEFVIKLSDMNSSFKPFLEDLCKHVLLMVDSLLEDDTVASENLSLLISNLLYPESALLHRFIKPIFEQILDTQRFWLLNQNCDFDENLEKFKKLCEMERSIETDASKYVKKIYESMSNVNRFLLLESNDRVSAMQIYFLLVNLMNEEDRTMALDRIYKMEHFSIIETIAALTSSNKMKFDFSRYHPADSARRFLNCLLHDDCLTIEKSCKEVANLLLTFLKEIKTEESPLNVILNREALRHWSNVAKVAVLARGLFMCEEFWNGHLKEEACRLLITLFTYCYGEHGKNVICSLESDVDTLRGSVTIALLYAFHTITSMGEFSVADSLLEQMSSLVREEVFEKELSQERISYAKEYAKVIFHCMNHCKQVDSAYSTKFICDQLLPSHDQWIKFMDTLASEWRALAVVNNALPASILNADNFSGEVFPRNLAEDEENMCRYLNMRSYFCLIGVFCANVAKSKAADKPVSIQYIRQLFDIFGTAQYLHLARSNCFDFGFFKQFDSILTDTQYCDDRLSCFVFHLIKGKMVPNFVFEFDGSDEPLCLLGLSNLLAKDVKLLNKLSHDDGFSDVVGISDEEGSESKSFAASDFSARLKGIQFVVHCIMGLHCCNMLSEKLNYNKFTHLTEEEQLQCKQEWFQFFLCQCIDNHLDTFFYHAENFSNCTMRRLLIYRLAVFISSLPRDALMKPVKNVLLSAKLSALKCDYFSFIYPESLQTIISRMLMLLRKQTATSFIFGLAAYFCLRKEVPSYFHEFLDDVRQASSVSRFSNSFLIFMYKYMIIWKLLFEYIAIVDKSQQDGYREWLYQQQHFIHLWRILVTFFVEHPADVEQVKKAINLFSPIESGRNAQKMNIVMFTDDVFNKISDTASVVWWLSLCVFRDFLTLFPTVTRQFWRSEKLLTSRIKRCKKKEKQYITLCPNVSEVVIAYGKDDFTISFTMKLPSNYPLNSTDVFLNVASGVPKDSFNFWIRKLAMRLQKHETNLLDSLLLWQAEVDKVLERMDVCPVCLSYTTSEGHLPSKKCYQCKHQFHGSCLQQWFQSTDRPSCPLCRELFVQNCSVDYCLLGKRNWIWGFSE